MRRVRWGPGSVVILVGSGMAALAGCACEQVAIGEADVVNTHTVVDGYELVDEGSFRAFEQQKRADIVLRLDANGSWSSVVSPSAGPAIATETLRDLVVGAAGRDLVVVVLHSGFDATTEQGRCVRDSVMGVLKELGVRRVILQVDTCQLVPRDGLIILGEFDL
jgi:hypothetical protein